MSDAFEMLFTQLIEDDVRIPHKTGPDDEELTEEEKILLGLLPGLF